MRYYTCMLWLCLAFFSIQNMDCIIRPMMLLHIPIIQIAIIVTCLSYALCPVAKLCKICLYVCIEVEEECEVVDLSIGTIFDHFAQP